MTPRTYTVNLTDPWRLILFMSICGLVFFSPIFILRPFGLGLLGAILALPLSVSTFFLLKRMFVIETEIGLGKKYILLKGMKIYFNDLKSYKTHRMRGAGLRLKLNSGKTIRLSSNDNFCDSDEFVQFTYDFEERISNEPTVEKIKSFGQTKFGLYFAISSTILIGTAIIIKTMNGEDLILSRLAGTLVVLTSIWSGIEIRKTFANKK